MEKKINKKVFKKLIKEGDAEIIQTGVRSFVINFCTKNLKEILCIFGRNDLFRIVKAYGNRMHIEPKHNFVLAKAYIKYIIK